MYFLEHLGDLTHIKVFLGNFNRKRAKAVVELSRIRLLVLTGLVIGHSQFGKHMARIGLRFLNT